MTSNENLREEVRSRYAEAATSVLSKQTNPLIVLESTSTDSCCGPSGCCGGETASVDEPFGASLYAAEQKGELPDSAVLASLGCGNPTAVADLQPGERVLDLGSGGGIDVLLSARRVGETGFAYGIDMTDEMLELARLNANKADVTNVEFVKGTIEEVPLPDSSIDVVISNCVINLSTDKPRVFAEMYRLLVPGGRIGISDVVAEDHLSPKDRAERGSFADCFAGALSRQEYFAELAHAGFMDAEIEFTHETAPGMHGAIIRAVKPR